MEAKKGQEDLDHIMYYIAEYLLKFLFHYNITEFIAIGEYTSKHQTEFTWFKFPTLEIVKMSFKALNSKTFSNSNADNWNTNKFGFA